MWHRVRWRPSAPNGEKGFTDHFVASMIEEAKRLGLSREELQRLIDRGFAQEEQEEIV